MSHWRDELQDPRISIVLRRSQWRRVKAAIGEMWSGDQDVLWDALDEFDLGEDPPAAVASVSPPAATEEGER